MNRSGLVLALARRWPLPFRALLRLSRSGLLPSAIDRHWLGKSLAVAIGEDRAQHWVRVVAHETCRGLLSALNPSMLSVLEISPGPESVWRAMPFKSYEAVDYPAYDICRNPRSTEYDLVIADNVLEHVLWPRRAAMNMHAMLRPGGHALVLTPFLIRLHVGASTPFDCTRWSDTGLRHLLADAGFSLEGIRAGAWGNRACLRAHLTDEQYWVPRAPGQRLDHEPDFPLMVWALAQK